MSAEDAKGFCGPNGTLLIIVLIIVLFAVLILHFNDRHHERELEVYELKTRVDALEEPERPWPNNRPNRPTDTGGTIL